MGTNTHFGVLALSELLVVTLELSSDQVSFPLTSMLNNSLYDPASVVFQYNVLYFSRHDVQQILDVLLAFCWGDIFLTCQRPDAFRIGDELRVGLCGFSLIL